MNEIDQAYELMKDCALDSGIITLYLRPSVVDIGKDSDYKGAGMSKTVVDEILQELFLSRLLRSNSHTKTRIRINAEENTPLKYLFKGDNMICTVHIDPLDGTKSYLEKKTDYFSSGYAISDVNNNFTHTVIYLPAKKRLYYASPTELGIPDCMDEPIDSRTKKIIYEKRLLSDKGKNDLQSGGFEIHGMHCAHMRVLDVALGVGGAYLYGVTNIHDSLIPSAFASKCGAPALKTDGTPISGKDIITSEESDFTKFERLLSVCYFSPSLGNSDKEKILDVLGNDENLSEQYLDYRKKLEGLVK